MRQYCSEILYFCNFSGGLGPPLPLSGSAHGHLNLVILALYMSTEPDSLLQTRWRNSLVYKVLKRLNSFACTFTFTLVQLYFNH